MNKRARVLSKRTWLIPMVSAMVASIVFLLPLCAQTPTQESSEPTTQATFEAPTQQTTASTLQNGSVQKTHQVKDADDEPDSIVQDMQESARFRKAILATIKAKFSPEMRERLQFLLQPDPTKTPEQQPMRAFRKWVQSKRPFIPVFIILLFSTLAACSFFPTQVVTAQEACRRQFWRCIGKGALVAILLVLASKILVAINFTHLAVVSMAFVQFLSIAGLCVSISLIGTRILEKCGLAEMDWMLAHPRWATFFAILIGTIIVAMITQIPGIGRFPKLGMRIVMLIAILGAGGLLKTRFGTKPMSSAAES